MTWKHAFAAGCLGIILGAIGAWRLLPQPVKTVVKVETVEKSSTDAQGYYESKKTEVRQERRNVKTVRREMPSGEVVTTTDDRTVIDVGRVEDLAGVVAVKTEVSKETKSETVTEPAKKNWYLGASWRVHPDASYIPRSGFIDRRLIGNVWIGIEPGVDAGNKFQIKARLGVTF